MEVKIISLSLAAERGRKYSTDKIELDKSGVMGDVHANTSRPVSMIDQSHIETFRKITSSRTTEIGEFAENIRVESLGEIKVKAFDRFEGNNVVLEVTQVGKPFHSSFREIGHYVMPRVGIFMRTIEGGTLQAGDKLSYVPKIFRAKVITLSDRASKGIYEDKSGAFIAEKLKVFFEKIGWELTIDKKIIPDNRKELKAQIDDAIQNQYDLVFTTGGTGIGSRDITLSVVKHLLDHEIPGIMENIRMKYGSLKPNALLSGGIAGTIGSALIYTLPGSEKAVNEYMREILTTLQHLIYMKADMDVH
ncbi:MAG: molybdopterin-binding protein [Bacteroidales bacterium]|jgi:molybdopterin adenylyltransferase|nr:molybdopterin-binding protein [Bacteroidales bacterium]